MRTDRRYSRVRAMITDPAIPRSRDGLLRLCRVCQRDVYFAGGFIRLLARAVTDRARQYRAVAKTAAKASA